MDKPATGWLHPDQNLERGDGVFYAVKYVGWIPLGMSMRDMDFDQRTAVAREAITRCCEANNMFPPKPRSSPPIVQQALPPSVMPNRMDLNIKLYISIKGLTQVQIDNDAVIGMHIMPSISFATGGGTADDAHVIGYVAKDDHNRRGVYVFDCGTDAQEIIATMGQGFELRYKAFLKKGNTPSGTPAMSKAVPQGDMYGDAAIYDQADGPPGGAGDTYGDAGVYGDDAYGETTYDTAGAAAVSADPGVYGDDATYDTAGAGGEAAYDTAAGTSGYLDTAPAPDGQVYGDDPLYDEAAEATAGMAGMGIESPYGEP